MFILMIGSITATTFTASKLFAAPSELSIYNSPENSVLDLQIEHPNDWEINNQSISHVSIGPKDGDNSQTSLNIFKFKNIADYSDVREWYEIHFGDEIDAEEIQIDGLSALKINQLIYIPQGMSHYMIRSGEGMMPVPMEDDLFQGIINTLEFKN